MQPPIVHSKDVLTDKKKPTLFKNCLMEKQTGKRRDTYLMISMERLTVTCRMLIQIIFGKMVHTKVELNYLLMGVIRYQSTGASQQQNDHDWKIHQQHPHHWCNQLKALSHKRQLLT